MRQQETTIQTVCLKKDGVYNLIKSRIFSNEYPPDYKFPNEPEFAKELGVARVTLRSAIEKLEEDGLITRFHGKGTFVKNNSERSEKVKSFALLISNATGKLEIPGTYIMPSFEKYCEARNIRTNLLPIELLRSLDEKHAVELLNQENYNAFLLLESNYLGHEKELKILKAVNKPVLIPHAQAGDNLTTGFATIRADFKNSWADALKHLVKQKHKNILTLASENGCLRGFEKKEYLDFLASIGANPDPALLLFVPYNHMGLTKLLKETLESPQPPSAIMCFSDFYAMNVYESLKSLSIKIPDDVAVMGYCGYPGAHMMDPPLSTVDLDYAGIGKMAGEILNSSHEWFEKGTPASDMKSPHKLIIREST